MRADRQGRLIGLVPLFEVPAQQAAHSIQELQMVKRH
jgi:hypothetical protein